MISFVQALYTMIESIRDNFGQNQALRIEKAKYCHYRFKNWSIAEILCLHDALPSSIRPPAHRRKVSSCGSMF